MFEDDTPSKSTSVESTDQSEGAMTLATRKRLREEMRKIAADFGASIDQGDLTWTTSDQIFSDKGTEFKRQFERRLKEFAATLPRSTFGAQANLNQTWFAP